MYLTRTLTQKKELAAVHHGVYVHSPITLQIREEELISPEGRISASIRIVANEIQDNTKYTVHYINEHAVWIADVTLRLTDAGDMKPVF